MVHCGGTEPRHIHNARPGGQGGQADEGSVGAIARGWFVCTEAGLRTRGDMARAVAAPVHADLVEIVGLLGFRDLSNDRDPQQKAPFVPKISQIRQENAPPFSRRVFCKTCLSGHLYVK